MEKDKNVFEVEVKIEKEEFEKAIDEAFSKKIKEVKLDGFRKGNVPKDVYLKKFGKESLYMDAIDVLLPIAYDKAIKDNNYEPILEPKVDLKSIDENGCTFMFTITTKPSVNIKKYKGLKVTKEEAKVTKEEIDAEIANMLSKYSELVVKEFGDVAVGNIAIIDFEGFLNDKAFEGGKGENYSLEIGSGSFIPGFEDQVVGMKKGEEKDIKVTFPKEYLSEELKGKEVTFKVKVNEIKEKIERKLDEEFFEDLAIPDVKDEESLRNQVSETLKSTKEMDLENAYVDNILKEIGNNTEVSVPVELIEHEIDHMVAKFNEQLRMQGMDINVYYEITKSKEEDLRNQMKEEATNHIKYRFILEEIKNKENIKVTDEEVNDEVKNAATTYGMSAEEFIKAVGGIESVRYEVEMRKVIEFLKENN